MTRLSARPRIGIALSPDRLVAVVPGGRQLETAEVGDLGRACAELRDAAKCAHALVTVALVPPLVELRRISLPPLREDERRRVLARDAERYFVGVRERQVIGTEVLASGRSPVPVLAAAASARLVEDLEAAVADAGWTLVAVVPAHAAWAAAVRARDSARAEEYVVAHLPHVTEVVRLEAGRIMERRRLRPGAADPPNAQVLNDPLAVAAEFAPRTHQLELCSEARHAARQRSARRVATGLGAAAAACLVLAAALDMWGLGRELAALRARRAALAPQVAAAMRARDSLGALTGSVSTLATLEATSPRWSAFLTDLGDYLPRDAHVVTLRGATDSVVLEGVARQAAGVFQAVQQIPRVVGVRAEGPIRQDVAADGTVREQFALGTLLRARAGAGAPRGAP
jgi:hypothetical protein